MSKNLIFLNRKKISDTLHEELIMSYCCLRYSVTIKHSLPVKLNHSVFRADEVKTLRERPTLLRYTYIAYLVRLTFGTL